MAEVGPGHCQWGVMDLGCNEAKKKMLFVFCNGLRKNRVGRSEINIFFALFFWSKMCVLCMFYVYWELEGWKKL